MPVLETERLIIRPFTMDDLDAIYQILDVELDIAHFDTEGAKLFEERRQWLRWTVMGYQELAKLYQPPYGERAVILKQTGHLIGTCGFVPCLDAFGQLPSSSKNPTVRLNSTEFGLFYAFSPVHHRQGYATEAVKAMIDFGFKELKLKRIVATTRYDNARSIGVMQRVGMLIEKNPYPDPPWLQVVGILENRLEDWLPAGPKPD
ncbi:MAG TPA: GNAT family N-acetyltransferase [candidate division Zixibacteria bacterium]|nr:GNAT family N-acetyltransferase [candidate division Zixibacteria bacterium]